MKYVLICLICLGFTTVSAQKKAGPIICDFGKVFTIENADLTLEKDKVYKVIFDVYTNTKEQGAINPLINTVARFLNMHGQDGVPPKNMDVALVLHGQAAKDALNDEAYKKLFEIENPNAKLISVLKEANVAIYVCGQSYKSRGLPLDGLSKDVKLSLSALTALVAYQENGYQIINFN